MTFSKVSLVETLGILTLILTFENLVPIIKAPNDLCHNQVSYA